MHEYKYNFCEFDQPKHLKKHAKKEILLHSLRASPCACAYIQQ